MKRLPMLMLSGLLCLSMIACGGADTSKNESSSNAVESSSALNETANESENESSEENTENESLNQGSDSGTEGSSEEHSEESTEEDETKPGAFLDDLYEFKVNIGKIAYRLPITYSSMTSRGWVYDGDSSVTLKPSQYTSQELMDRDDVILLVSFLNVDIHTQEIKDTLIGQITFDKLNLIGCETEIMFPGDIVYGVSTKEDVVFAYGKPSSTKDVEGKEQEQLVYEKDEFQYVTFTIDKTANVVCGVDICNFTEPENFKDGDISEDVPQEVLDYIAPEELGDDLSCAYVEIEDGIYELPAPVSAFLENGWSIVQSDSHEAVVAKGIGNITLEKDGVYLTTDVVNYTDKAVYVENCFVTTVYIDLEENDKGMIKIPNGISLKMPVKELESALEHMYYTTDKDKKSTYYTINLTGGEESAFIIRVSKDTQMVDAISCQIIPEDY